MTARGALLCLNCGSSSIKAAWLEPAPGERAGTERRVRAVAVEGVGSDAIVTALDRLGPAPSPPVAVAHRLVHGGPRHAAPIVIDERVMTELRDLIPLAPLHLPVALGGIEATAGRWRRVPQIACFDTGFHASLPEVARRLPLPASVLGTEVRRYGFHGLSYAHVVWTLGPTPPARVVIAHLGSGASLAALRDGRSVDTTMGFTPTGGIPMGTRTGDVDPGILFYLARARGASLSVLEDLCEHQAGLRGVAGSPDVRGLIARAPKDPSAALALEMFAYAIRKAIGAFAAVLGGLDLLVFTGGVGEHVPSIRAEACVGLEPLGLRIDPARNEANAEVISQEASPCQIRVVAADEEATMARETRALLSGLAPPPTA